MFNNSVHITRFGLGIVASIVVVLLLDWVTWKIDGPPFQISGRYYLWLAIIEPVCLFSASFAGAYIAKAIFLAPAIVLAVGVCLLSDSFFDVFNRGAECGLFAGDDFLRAVVFVLAVGGSVLGAYLGRRLAEPHNRIVPNAA